MQINQFLVGVSFVAVIVIVAALYWVTYDDTRSRCEQLKADISAAVLADAGDQQAMTNRALFERLGCDEQK